MYEDYGYVAFTGNDCVLVEINETGVSAAAIKNYAETISKLEVNEEN